ncbi:collagen alpha-1(I) chain-like [Motacilla alba alba]|uniref:collagen alpha-1(I) chain-like n=1 Tax=Motacilla alba alba TaxID=1094192 RepID=UPI0018D534B1|nr:collagen alpha-1(I) chain-like [Motacilla alba alba]
METAGAGRLPQPGGAKGGRPRRRGSRCPSLGGAEPVGAPPPPPPAAVRTRGPPGAAPRAAVARIPPHAQRGARTPARPRPLQRPGCAVGAGRGGGAVATPSPGVLQPLAAAGVFSPPPGDSPEPPRQPGHAGIPGPRSRAVLHTGCELCVHTRVQGPADTDIQRAPMGAPALAGALEPGGGGTVCSPTRGPGFAPTRDPAAADAVFPTRARDTRQHVAHPASGTAAPAPSLARSQRRVQPEGFQGAAGLGLRDVPHAMRGWRGPRGSHGHGGQGTSRVTAHAGLTRVFAGWRGAGRRCGEPGRSERSPDAELPGRCPKFYPAPPGVEPGGGRDRSGLGNGPGNGHGPCPGDNALAHQDTKQPEGEIWRPVRSGETRPAPPPFPAPRAPPRPQFLFTVMEPPARPSRHRGGGGNRSTAGAAASPAPGTGADGFPAGRCAGSPHGCKTAARSGNSSRKSRAGKEPDPAWHRHGAFSSIGVRGHPGRCRPAGGSPAQNPPTHIRRRLQHLTPAPVGGFLLTGGAAPPRSLQELGEAFCSPLAGPCTFGAPYLGHRGCSQPGSGPRPICQDRMWGRTGDTMWGSEKGTAGTGTSRRRKRAHSPSRAAGHPELRLLQVPCAPPAPLVLPPASRTCLARGALPAAACPRAAETRRSWLGRAGVGWERGPLSPHRCGRAGCGSKAPRPAGPVLLGGRSLPRRSQPGAAGHTPSLPQLPALPGQGGGGRAGTARWRRGRREGIAHPRLALPCRGIATPPCEGPCGDTPAPHPWP